MLCINVLTQVLWEKNKKVQLKYQRIIFIEVAVFQIILNIWNKIITPLKRYAVIKKKTLLKHTALW